MTQIACEGRQFDPVWDQLSFFGFADLPTSVGRQTVSHLSNSRSVKGCLYVLSVFLREGLGSKDSSSPRTDRLNSH